MSYPVQLAASLPSGFVPQKDTSSYLKDYHLEQWPHLLPMYAVFRTFGLVPLDVGMNERAWEFLTSYNLPNNCLTDHSELYGLKVAHGEPMPLVRVAHPYCPGFDCTDWLTARNAAQANRLDSIWIPGQSWYRPDCALSLLAVNSQATGVLLDKIYWEYVSAGVEADAREGR